MTAPGSEPPSLSDPAVISDRAEMSEPAGISSVRPSLRAVLAWVGSSFVFAALDGVFGLVVGVGLAAWLLAGFRPRTLLLVSATLWAAIPVVHLVDGLPPPSQISPAFANDNPLSYHLAFAGTALLVATSILDRPTARQSGDHEHGSELLLHDEPLGRVPVIVRKALVVMAGAGLLVASVAVGKV